MSVLAPSRRPTAVAPETRPRKPRGRGRRRRWLESVAERSLLIALAFIVLMPFALILLTSLMTNAQTLSPRLWPEDFQWHNFADVFTRIPLARYAANTFLYAGLGTVGTLLSSVPAAYAMAKLRWRGRHVWLLLTVAVMMLPAQVTLVPLYSMWASLGLVGTLAPLIVPFFFGHAFSIFLLRQFFLTIPQEYLEAARIDGCGELRTLLRVVLPLTRPALAAVAVFQFTFCWNDFMGPLLYVGNNDSNWTIPVGLAQFRSTYQVEWNLTMAASLLAAVPVVVLFFFAQKTFVRGIALTGVKG
ncbi:carbohydrate ABC transporter permease [Streptomyces tubbatahanensis]|uniref:Carbohydrate ABC transporter permease n=1 Tax=Streptomyces tubbatahanensis TaxID=2923272 RepID=A0ABY3Y2K7_9ACTN|nr:carbohydrate ABC transporter permease [Streptomyces tubbatahanensis]UNT00758.1 carbohydrate ABC transporter permease [Streptomyces tubbatahanensis]